jgi:hypothetical protein
VSSISAIRQELHANHNIIHDSEFKCPFCTRTNPSDEKWDAKSITEHLAAQHQLDPKTYLLILCDIPTIGKIRILFPPTNRCPISTCKSTALRFNGDSFGVHIRTKHRNSKSYDSEFVKQLTNGAYFWFHSSIRYAKSKKSTSKACSRLYILTFFIDSPAFDVQSLFEAAWTAFETEVIAEGDDVLEEIQDTLDNADDDFAHADEEHITEALSQLGIQDNQQQLSDQNQAEALRNIDVDMETTVPNTHEEPIDPALANQYKNVSMPIELGAYNCALLHLRDFPDQPTVVICLQCRKALRSDQDRVVKRHWSRHQMKRHPNVDGDSVEEGLPIPDDADSEDARSDTGVDRHDLPLDTEDEENQVLEIEDVETTTYLANISTSVHHAIDPKLASEALKTFFETQPTLITKLIDKKSFPNFAIQPIPILLPPIPAYVCTNKHCRNISIKASNMARHTCKTTMGRRRLSIDMDQTMHEDGDGEDEYLPGQKECRVQQLYGGDQGYFVVSDVDPEYAPDESIDKQIGKLLDIPIIHTGSNPAGLQHTSLLLRKFLYHTIWPDDFKLYEKFLNQRIPYISIIYGKKHRSEEARQDQKPIHQLLAITLFLYTHRWRFELENAEHLIQSHLGNKSK